MGGELRAAGLDEIAGFRRGRFSDLPPSTHTESEITRAILVSYGPNSTISSTILLGGQFFLDPVKGNNTNFTVGQGTVLIHEPAFDDLVN